MQCKKHPERWLRHLISVPFIYALIIPLVILDIFLEIYHQICFPLYGIKKFKRSEYIKLDRHKLKYITTLERVYCAYCSYANGLMNYARMIIAATEV